MVADFGVIRLAHADCISDMDHNRALKIQMRMHQMGWHPSLICMCGLALSSVPRKEDDKQLAFLDEFPWLLSVSHFLQGHVPLLR